MKITATEIRKQLKKLASTKAARLAQEVQAPGEGPQVDTDGAVAGCVDCQDQPPRCGMRNAHAGPGSFHHCAHGQRVKSWTDFIGSPFLNVMARVTHSVRSPVVGMTRLCRPGPPAIYHIGLSGIRKCQAKVSRNTLHFSDSFKA